MREIKFRAWHPATKEMEYDRFVLFSDEGRYRLNDYDNCTETPDPIVMQFTGIKDVDGKDIYEGDIVKISLIPFTRKAVVQFNDGCFDVVSGSWRDYLKCHTCNHVVKVIGNIYENCNLLEALR